MERDPATDHASRTSEAALQLVRERAASMGNGLAEAVGEDPRGPVARLVFLSSGNPEILVRLAADANIQLPDGQLEDRRHKLEKVAAESRDEKLALAKEAAGVAAASVFWDKFVSNANAGVREQSASEEKKPVGQMSATDIAAMSFESFKNLSDADRRGLLDKAANDAGEKANQYGYAREQVELGLRQKYPNDPEKVSQLMRQAESFATYLHQNEKAGGPLNERENEERARQAQAWLASQGVQAIDAAAVMEAGKNIFNFDITHDAQGNLLAAKGLDVGGQYQSLQQGNNDHTQRLRGTNQVVDTAIGQMEQRNDLLLQSEQGAYGRIDAENQNEATTRAAVAAARSAEQAAIANRSTQDFAGTADDFGQAPAARVVVSSTNQVTDYTTDLTALRRAEALLLATDMSTPAPADAYQPSVRSPSTASFSY